MGSPRCDRERHWPFSSRVTVAAVVCSARVPVIAVVRFLWCTCGVVGRTRLFGCHCRCYLSRGVPVASLAALLQFILSVSGGIFFAGSVGAGGHTFSFYRLFCSLFCSFDRQTMEQVPDEDERSREMTVSEGPRSSESPLSAVSMGRGYLMLTQL